MAAKMQMLVPPGEARWVRVGRHVVIVARGDWERRDDEFMRVLDAAGIPQDHGLAAQDWTYTWDESTESDIWMIEVPA